jgi:hypothetical protein
MRTESALRPIGALPNVYEPIWYADKATATGAEAVAPGDSGVSRDQIRVFSSLPDGGSPQQILIGGFFA